MRYKFIIICLVIELLSCKSASVNHVQYFNDSIPIVKFCDLPKNRNKLVFLKAVYSGIEEYWSLNDINRTRCQSELRIDLQYAGIHQFNPPPKFDSVFQKVSRNYFKSYLVIEAVGIFEDKDTTYGHLGTNNARFMVTELVSAKLITK